MGNSLNLLWTLLAQLPSQITILVCLVLVLVRWKRSPKASLLALIGLLLLFLHAPIFSFLFALAPELFRGTVLFDNMFNILGLLSYSLVAIAFLPLLAAVFIQRNQAKAASQNRPS
jgi:hypothetical protein